MASSTITANAVAVSSFWEHGIGLLLLPLSLGSLVVVRRSRRKLQGLVCLLVLLLGGASLVSGCSGSGDSAKSLRETGNQKCSDYCNQRIGRTHDSNSGRHTVSTQRQTELSAAVSSLDW